MPALTPIRRLQLIYTGFTLALFALWLVPALLLENSEASVVFTDVTTPVYSLFALMTLTLAAWQLFPASRRLAIAWIILALAQLSATIAEITWSVLELGLGLEPFPSIADVFYLLFYPLFLACVLYLPTSRKIYKERIKVWLEIAIIMISAGLFLWNFIVGPLFVLTSAEDLLGLIVSLAYPLFDLFIVLAMLVLVFRRGQGISAGPLWLIVSSMCVWVISDTAFSIVAIQDDYSHMMLINAGYILSYLLLGQAGIRQASIAIHGDLKPNEASAEKPATRQNWLHGFLPPATLAAAYLLLVVSFSYQLPMRSNTLVLWIGLLVGLAILLQRLVSNENAWLNRRLNEMNTQLEQRVEQRTGELEVTNHVLQNEIATRQRVAEALQVSEALYRAVVEDLPVFICRFLPGGKLTFVNEAYCRYFKLDRERLLGQSFFSLIPEEDQELVQSHYAALTQANPVVKYEHRVYAPTGEIRWQRWIDRAVFEEAQLMEYQSIGEDITEQRLAEEALRDSEEKFRDLFNNSTNLIQIVSPDSRFIFVNQAWEKALGYREAELQDLRLWDLVHPDCIDSCRKAFDGVMSGADVLECETIFIAHDGRQITVEGNVNCRFKDSKPEYIRGIFHDVTERKKAEAALVRNAYTDSLTGLSNRAHYTENLEQVIQRAAVEPDYKYANLFLDIDNFKLVNDSLGHPVGDQLLVQVAERLVGSVRYGDLVARLGGDEFVILLDGVTDLADVTSIAERIIAEVKQPIVIQGHKIIITVSMGVVINNYQEGAEGNLRDADIAMYCAKVNGKDRFELFEPGLRGKAIERLRLDNDLRNAIQRHEFRVFYQPIYSFSDRQVRGFEALLRWKHPERGILPPAEFITMAEETGLIVPLGYWVLREAAAQAVAWQHDYPLEPPLMISVNVAARQLAQPDFSHQVMQALEETGLSPYSLALEITESALFENIDQAATILGKLSSMGIQLHLDDFGTGYSSLGRLQQLPFHTIKIDRSFVQKIGSEGGNLELVRAIIILSSELGLDTVAEGVEHEYQMAKLAELGCGMGQGFYFGKPLPPTATGGLLKKAVCLAVAPEMIVLDASQPSGGRRKNGHDH